MLMLSDHVQSCSTNREDSPFIFLVFLEIEYWFRSSSVCILSCLWTWLKFGFIPLFPIHSCNRETKLHVGEFNNFSVEIKKLVKKNPKHKKKKNQNAPPTPHPPCFSKVSISSRLLWSFLKVLELKAELDIAKYR